MKMMKKVTSLFLATILVFATFAVSGVSVSAQVYSGDCSYSSEDNVMWSFDSSTGTLTFSGEGTAEASFVLQDMPWSQFEENIDRVIIENGVDISLGRISNCRNIFSIEIGQNFGQTTMASAITPRHYANLKSIYVDKGNKNYSSVSGILFRHAFYSEDVILECYPSQKKEITYNVPTNVTEIGYEAFYNCTLETITIPDSVEKIGYDAFKGSKIYNDTANWDNGVLYINDCLIEVDPNFKGVLEVRPGTRLIAVNALSSCSGITDLIIPESLKFFNSQFFSNDEYTQFRENGALYLGSCLIEADYDFKGSSHSPTDFTIKDGTQFIAEDALSNCDSYSITIPKSVTIINDCLTLSDAEVINYAGTRYEWSQIKIYGEDFYDITINCTDGVYKNGVIYENTTENTATNGISATTLLISIIVIIAFATIVFIIIKKKKKAQSDSSSKEYKTLS